MTDLIHIARQIRDHLRQHRLDLAPRSALTAALGVTEAAITAAAHRFADFGLCGPPDQPHVWWLPMPPLLAGFQPVYLRGHLVLRLAAPSQGDPSHGDPVQGEQPLHLAAHNLAAPPREQPLTPQLDNIGLGPLGRTVTQLCLMTPSSCEMFELIAHTWRTGAVVFTAGALQVRQTEQPPADLELVTWNDDHGNLQMINLYPTGMHHLVFDTEEA